jgi:regulator of protease activity HflC (stomatin/prohibitin superfamily)
MTLTKRGKWIVVLLVLLGGGWFLYQGFRWTVARVWVGPDEMMVIISRVGKDLAPGQILAKEGQKGVKEEVLGTGRHFINPINEEYEIHPLIYVRAGTPPRRDGDQEVASEPPQVGIVTSLIGTELPEGEFLAEPGQKGVWKRVLTPGKYRLNPYAYKVELASAVVIEPGYVGVVTHLAGENSTGELAKPHQRGVLEDVLTPGIYYLNPREFRVSAVEIGYNELTFEDASSIIFPTSDGNTVRIDGTIIWGIYPADAPHIIKQFGSEEKVVNLVIRPQAESTMRLEGSNYTSRQFVEGDSREQFQQAVTASLKSTLERKNIRMLLTLIRNIDVPDTIKKPIQSAKIAEEQNLTNRVKIETAKVLTELNEVKGTVDIEAATARTETLKLMQEERAKGQAEVAKIEAETELKVAEKLSQAARERGEALKILGKADADVVALMGAAQAEGMRLKIAPFEDPNAYALWRFADGLPDDMRIELRYAGVGTFWTDSNDPAKMGAGALNQLLKPEAKPK